MAHPVDVHVGQRLRERRTELGMSQETLAKNSGITFQQVQKYERATNRISVSRMFEFASILKVPIDFFFRGAEGEGELQLAESATPFTHEDKSLASEYEELIKIYSNIKDPQMRKSVITLMQGIANGAPLI